MPSAKPISAAQNLKGHNAILKECNRIVPPEKGDLPAYNVKAGCIQEIYNIVQQHHQKEELPILYRYCPANAYNLLSVLNQEVYLMDATKMNDAYEGRVICKDSFYNYLQLKIRGYQKHTYLKSFCAKRDDPVMWEEYGDQHRGICITYDLNKLSETSPILGHLFPVQYSNVPFISVSPKKLENNPYFYLRKETKWEHECEWRLVYLKNALSELNGKRFVSLNNCITSITFGACMDEDLKQSICKAIESTFLNPKIAMYEAKLSPRLKITSKQWGKSC